MNVINLLGRLTSTPELKQTQSGVSVLSFTIAVNRSYVAKGEERQADFIDCVAWRGTAEFISKYFSKGQMIAVTGELQTRTYQDKNGNNRKAIEVVVSNTYFCGSKEQTSNNYQTTQGTPDVDKEDDFTPVDDDEDLPF